MPTTNTKPVTRELTPRTPEIIGRDAEIKNLKEHLYRRGERHFLYYYADGGLGKTRLLETLNKLVNEANQKEPGYASTGIIDLYHTDTHSTSDVERAIIDGLDPEHKYFPQYRSERRKFEEWRERGIEPDLLERHRQGLGKLFVDEWGKMALDARKLVICFDTVELLQYESSVVEEKAGLDATDTRLKPWLLDKLAQLKNVLVVFAGRPKLTAPNEDFDPQKRLVDDFQTAFGNDFTAVRLEPLNLQETDIFLKSLTGSNEVIPAQYLPIIHRLTGGRPIFIHLIVDYLCILAPGTRDYFERLDQYKNLVNVQNDDPDLVEAQEKTEAIILDSVFNQGGELGEYLSQIALMPKGVDVDILHATLGMATPSASELLKQFFRLSFVKRFIPTPGAERLHGERIFLHDEIYKLLSRHRVIRSRAMHEIRTAYALIENYYNPHILALETEIKTLKSADPETITTRITDRERLQKLQVERLYYLLTNDPRAGYEEYKRLTIEANRSRSVGFSMRLLDEFLRFYNDEQHRGRFEQAGISHEQVIRESAELWVERFHRWGQRSRAMAFANQILDRPGDFYIDPESNLAILSNVRAFYTLNYVQLKGYDEKVIESAKELLTRLSPPPICSIQDALARARLSTAIGFGYRLGGQLQIATEFYLFAKTTFEWIKDQGVDYLDERSMLLNNLAYAYAKQGRMALARPLAHEALEAVQESGSEYSIGLTLSTLATIARMRSNYSQAKMYAQRALRIFKELNDPHGIALSSLNLAYAIRRMAKHDMEKRWEIEVAYQQLQEALSDVEKALYEAEKADLKPDIAPLLAELGRFYRELGNLAKANDENEQSLEYYQRGMSVLNKVIEMEGRERIDQADTYQDLAELVFLSGNRHGALEYLEKMYRLMGLQFQEDEKVQPISELPSEYYAPLGKAEMLRGQMSFVTSNPFLGLQHYVKAYLYFSRFSADANEVENMVEYLYNHIRLLPIVAKKNLMDKIKDWLNQNHYEQEAYQLIEILADLLGE